jgi:hypothetical protein
MLTFDNRYSIIKCKNITYRIALATPNDDTTPAQLPKGAEVPV